VNETPLTSLTGHRLDIGKRHDAFASLLPWPTQRVAEVLGVMRQKRLVDVIDLTFGSDLDGYETAAEGRTIMYVKLTFCE
jgi:hypothetical protein